jgi:hypothetical protein
VPIPPIMLVMSFSGSEGNSPRPPDQNGGCAEARVRGYMYYWIEMLSLFCTFAARCRGV